MRSAARRLDMALAAHAVGCHASSRVSLGRPPRVGGRGRWDESPTRGVSIRRRAFSSEAPATFPDAPPPVTHLLTAYDMNAAPTMQVTPLRLEGMGAELPGELGSRLWRAIRLARDVRGEGSGAGSAPELFAPAPRSWGEGVALRLGARGAVTDAVEASLRAENASFALVEEPARALDEALVRSRPEVRAAYAALLREALYAHAAAEAAPARGFEVSRTRDCGVRFLETRARGGTRPNDRDARGCASFETALRVDEGGAPRLVVSVRARERRSTRTVRDLLDDPGAACSVRSGLEVVALGGPALAGALLLEGDEGAPSAGAVGEPRPELNGDSLLEYHRKRYPARVELLRGADASARAVWLVPRSATNRDPTKRAFGAFGGPMAYPAELLAPRRETDAGETDVASEDFEKEKEASPAPRVVAAASPARIQERATSLRAALGQPFVRVFGADARLADRMTRLPEPRAVSSGPCGRLVGAGGVAGGPARAPRAVVDAAPRLVLVPAAALRGEAPPADGADVEALRARLADGVAAAHEAWSVPSAATRATRNDLRTAQVATGVFPETPRTGGDAPRADAARRVERVLRDAARAGADRVIVETGGSAALESAVRRACASARLPAPRRCAFGSSARELALELGATRGGQASTFPGFAARPTKPNLLDAGEARDEKKKRDAPRGTVFVGVSGVPSLARRGGELAERVVVAVADEDAALLFDGARARRLRARLAFEEARASTALPSEDDEVDDEVDEVDDATTRVDEPGPFDDSRAFTSSSFASASRLAGAAAARAALEACAPSTPDRLVAHHEGKSHRFFAEAFEAFARERGVSSIDVVDVEREPASVTGRVLRWDKKHGVDAPERGLTWALSETRAVAVTAGDDAPRAARSDAERRRDGSTMLARPLFLRRVAGETGALAIAGEVVALAETRVDGFGGAHAMPVTLRGGGRQTRVVTV